jgi:tetratricopeptide (TPR) repeat protein
MENNKNTTAIDTCLDEQLKQAISTDEAKQILAANQVTDADAAIALHRLAATSIQRYSILQQVQQVHNRYLAEHTSQDNEVAQVLPIKRSRLFGKRMVVKIAAILVLSLAVGLGYQYATNSSDKLYQELYHPYNVSITRAPGDPVNKIVSLYEANNYAGVIQAYSELSTSSTREKFFAAMAYVQTNQYPTAIALFENILSFNKTSGTKLYNDEAEYYLGLAYLKEKQNDKAYTILKAIANEPSHTYREAVNKWLLIRLKWLK